MDTLTALGGILITLLFAVFKIVKVIFLILLILSVALIVIILILLLSPIKYSVIVNSQNLFEGFDSLYSESKVSYLFGIIKIDHIYKNKESVLITKIFGKDIESWKKIFKRKKKDEELEKDNDEDNEIEEIKIKLEKEILNDSESFEIKANESKRIEIIETEEETDDEEFEKEEFEKTKSEEIGTDGESEYIETEENQKDESSDEENKKNKKSKKESRKSKKNKKDKSKKGESFFVKLKQNIEKAKRIYYYPNRKKIQDKLIKELKCILKALNPKILRLTCELGLEDTAMTGRILGAFYALNGIWQKDIHLIGDFTRKILVINLYVKGKIVLGAILYPIIRFLLSKPIFKIIVGMMKGKNKSKSKKTKKSKSKKSKSKNPKKDEEKKLLADE